MARIKIADLLGTDIRTRAKADMIRSAIKDVNEEVILDFENVIFISRSFADELYNIVEQNENIVLDNLCQIVQSMIDTVRSGRSSKRVFKSNDSEMKRFNDMKSLSKYLSTIL